MLVLISGGAPRCTFKAGLSSLSPLFTGESNSCSDPKHCRWIATAGSEFDIWSHCSLRELSFGVSSFQSRPLNSEAERRRFKSRNLKGGRCNSVPLLKNDTQIEIEKQEVVIPELVEGVNQGTLNLGEQPGVAAGAKYIDRLNDGENEEALTFPWRTRGRGSRVSNAYAGTSREKPDRIVSFLERGLEDDDGQECLNKEQLEQQRISAVLKVRRQAAKEVLVGALKERLVGKTYSEELGAQVAPFVDLIVLQAVALKRDEEHAQMSFSQRAATCIKKLRVVELVKFLKNHGQTQPKIAKLIVLGGNDLMGVYARIQWLKSVGVKGTDLGKVLTHQPGVLTTSLDALQDRVDRLIKAGVSPQRTGVLIARAPLILVQPPEELQAKIAFLEGLLGQGRYGSKERFGALMHQFPAVVSHFSVEEMQSKVSYLQGLGLDAGRLGDVIAKRPQLLACTIETAWEPLVAYLGLIGINHTTLGGMVVRKPSILCLDLKNNLAPKVRFFRALGVADEDLGQMLDDFPSILSYSLDKKLRPLAKVLLEEAGVAERDLGKVISSIPQIFGASIEGRVLQTARFFQHIGVQKPELGSMIAQFPVLIRYNPVILRPKWRYLNRKMGLLVDTIIAYPRFFSYSLEGRIIPRHKEISKRNIQVSLRQLLACSDEVFLRRLQEWEAGTAAGDLTLSGDVTNASLEEATLEGCKPCGSGSPLVTAGPAVSVEEGSGGSDLLTVLSIEHEKDAAAEHDSECGAVW